MPSPQNEMRYGKEYATATIIPPQSNAALDHTCEMKETSVSATPSCRRKDNIWIKVEKRYTNYKLGKIFCFSSALAFAWFTIGFTARFTLSVISGVSKSSIFPINTLFRATLCSGVIAADALPGGGGAGADGGGGIGLPCCIFREE